MRIRMLVGIVEMPSFTVREEGGIYDVPDELGRLHVATHMAVPVIDEQAQPEMAAVQGGTEAAVLPRAGRKRG
jgi:hypothetical protein